jgi:hypothetical protein
MLLQEQVANQAESISPEQVLLILQGLAPFLSRHPHSASQRFLLLSTQLLRNGLWQLTTPQVLSILAICIQLRWRPSLLLREVVLWALDRLHVGPQMLSPSAHVYVVWAAAKIGYKSQVVAAHMKALFLEMTLPQRSSSGGQTPSFESLGAGSAFESCAGFRPSPKQLAQLLWACGRQQYRNRAVLRLLASLLMASPPEQVEHHQVSMSLWALARLGVSSERVSRWAVRCVEGVLSTMQPQALANVCWSLGKLGACFLAWSHVVRRVG